MAVSLAVSEIFSIKGWRDLEIRVRVTQVHTIRKLWYGFQFAVYSSSLTMTIFLAFCEISNVKEYRDLENWVRGHSRSLKMAPFHRP